jgi:hypothetical protein
MKGLLFLLVFLSVAIFFGCSNQSQVSVSPNSNSAVAVTATVWNSYNQSEKDMTIFSVAMSYIDQANNNCKVFVQTVVTNASGGAVAIPGTNTKQLYSWITPLPSSIVNRNVTDIANVAPMDIIQMYYYPGSTFGWTAHTAIVISKTSTQMTWVDANFKKNAAGVMAVETHDVTFTSFKNCLKANSANLGGGNFTVYHVQ